VILEELKEAVVQTLESQLFEALFQIAHLAALKLVVLQAEVAGKVKESDPID